MKKRIIIGLAAAAIVVGGVAAMSAFEAHIINVTAKIENALSVSPEKIEFGTVFPQEKLFRILNIALSSSFIEEDRVDDVNYVIKQKPKPRPNGVFDDLPGHEYCLNSWNVAWHLYESCAFDYDGDPLEAWEYCKHILYDSDTSYDRENCYPMLCPFLSKLPDGTPDNDKGVSSPHWPGCMDVATGRLAKSEQDTEDIWTIDLVVPCFQGMCDQTYDWTEFGFPLVPELEHEVFGCDLWIEVTGISRALKLENKNSSWEIIDDGMYGILSYDASGPTFNYTFNGYGLAQTTNYSLIYYADKPDRFVNWGGNNPGKLIGSGTTDATGNLAISDNLNLGMDLPSPNDANIDEYDYCTGTGDSYETCHGAKIWLVPTSDYSAPELTAWNPTTYLFETDLINYEDTDN